MKIKAAGVYVAECVMNVWLVHDSAWVTNRAPTAFTVNNKG